MANCNLSEIAKLLKQGQCLLGIDTGSVVIGLAISDPGLTVASPLLSLTRKKFMDDVRAIQEIIKSRNVGALVIGLPKNMDGSEGQSAQSAKTFAHNLFAIGKIPDMPVLFWDERLSTTAVERSMIENNMRRTRREEIIDKVAACYILQGVLDGIKK